MRVHHAGREGAAASAYPVIFDAEAPERYQRRHVFLRLLIVLAFLVTAAFAWAVTLVYVAVPVLAASLISRDGAEEYVRSSHRRLLRYLHWLVAFDAYITLLLDRLPAEEAPEAVRYEVAASGRPAFGDALLRLLYSLPSALALAALGVVAVFTWVPAAASIVARGRYPAALHGFHLGVVRWGARLLAYHASMTDVYPPFRLETGRGGM